MKLLIYAMGMRCVIPGERRPGAGRLLFTLFLVVMTGLAAGCGSLLPSAKQTVLSPWNSFDEAKADFDRIVPYESKKEDLRALGFDPYSIPNIKILTYLDIMNRFMPNPSIRREDLDEGIQACIEVRARCGGFDFSPTVVNSKRYGSVLADLLNFRRRTNETGWQFQALIVLIDDVVVYKLWGGRPIIDEYRETKNPLGPLQNANDLLVPAAAGGL